MQMASFNVAETETNRPTRPILQLICLLSTNDVDSRCTHKTRNFNSFHYSQPVHLITAIQLTIWMVRRYRLSAWMYNCVYCVAGRRQSANRRDYRQRLVLCAPWADIDAAMAELLIGRDHSSHFADANATLTMYLDVYA